MINGIEYSYEDIRISILGESLIGFQEIKYTTTKKHENIYGRGDEPVAMGRGIKDYSGNISLLQSEIEKIQAKLPPGQDLTDLPPFGITVSYAVLGMAAKTDQLVGCRISSYEKGGASDNTSMPVKLDLKIFKVSHNI